MTAAALSVTVGMLVGAVLTIGNNARSDSLLLPTSTSSTASSPESEIDSSVIDEVASDIDPASSARQSAPVQDPVPGSSAPLSVAGTSSVRPSPGPALRTTASRPTAAKRPTAAPTPVVRIVYVPPQPTATSGRTVLMSTVLMSTVPTSTGPAPTRQLPAAPIRRASPVPIPSPVAVRPTPVPVRPVPVTRTPATPTGTTARAPVAVQACGDLGEKRVTTAGYHVFCQRNFPNTGLAWRPVVDGGGCLNRTMTGIGVDGRNYLCRANSSGLNRWEAGTG